jgi:uncharacterized protein (TIGR00251 family)
LPEKRQRTRSGYSGGNEQNIAQVQGNVQLKEEKTTIVVQVQPKSSRNRVTGFEDGVLYVKIAAPPVKGEANRELLRFLSDILGTARSNITIEKGLTSRRKVISIKGLGQEEVVRGIYREQARV